ncbi:MAG: hypothetical protein LBH28_05110, partial [Oscillospiraceae bacterium]|nr:hypothetical protein [Oscillospiraceae bacterium]
MKRKQFKTLIGIMLCIAFVAALALPLQSAVGADVSLTVLNPKGRIEMPPLQRLAPRLDSLAGKRIMFVGYGKDIGNTNRQDYAYNLAEMLRDWYGAIPVQVPAAQQVSGAISSGISGLLSDVAWEKGDNSYETWA